MSNKAPTPSSGGKAEALKAKRTPKKDKGKKQQKKRKKDDVSDDESPGARRATIDIDWVYTKSRSLLLEALRTQYYDEDQLTQLQNVMIEVQDPGDVLFDTLVILMSWDRAVAWWTELKEKPRKGFMSRQKYDHHRASLIGWLLACDGDLLIDDPLVHGVNVSGKRYKEFKRSYQQYLDGRPKGSLSWIGPSSCQ